MLLLLLLPLLSSLPLLLQKHFSFSSNEQLEEKLKCFYHIISYSSFPSQVPCGLPSGQEAVRYFGFLPKFSSLSDGEEEGDDPPSFSSLPLEEQLARMAPLLITAAFALFFFVLGAIFFLGRRQNTKRSRARLGIICFNIMWESMKNIFSCF